MNTIKPALVELYKAVVTARVSNDTRTICIVRGMLDGYHKATEESDNGFAFDLYLAAGLLLDTSVMGDDSLARLAITHPEYVA